MLCRKKIELPLEASRLSHLIISREMLSDCFEVNQLLSHANIQAEKLLSRAEDDCLTLQKQAESKFWERANAQLVRWSRERQVMWSSLEQRATIILNHAIQQLLNETVDAQRLAALLKQLMKSQIPEVSATLHCCPDEIDYIKRYLTNHTISPWKLQPDISLPPQTLVLKTEEGDFFIDWNAMAENLLKPADVCQTDENSFEIFLGNGTQSSNHATT